MPPVTAPARADELWQHTCFEAFVRASPGAAYYEFNFAPSTQWAAYRFERLPKRDERCERDQRARASRCNRAPERYTLQASLELERLPGLPSDALWRLGLSAVIEETSGNKSYWALAHPPGKPDFHHADCFALELAAA